MLLPAEALSIAREVVGLAAARLAESAADRGPIRNKGNPRDLVTKWDLEIEALITSALAERTPAIPVLGEEGGLGSRPGQPDDSGVDACWVVDPIDGTVNFAHGLPIYSISVALEIGGEAVCGVVRAPALGWEFYAAKGGGAYCNQVPLCVSRIDALDQALLVSGFPYDRATSPDNNFAEWEHFQRNAGACRRLGSAALDLCLVAQGAFDGYWERKLQRWDVAAGALIVTEAGGTVTGPTGGPYSSAAGALVASNGRIHHAIVSELAVVAEQKKHAPKS